jgi:cobalt-zinc-cadmium resistance protein CzcA
MIAGLHAAAQQVITLPAAIDSALKNNLSLQASRTETGYYRALKKSGFDPDKTNLGFELGKFNSRATDNRIAISQTIQFPTVYKHQENINRTNIRISETNLQKREQEIRANVKQLFYRILVMQKKQRLLQEADSMYQNFLFKTRQRFKAGETDILEQSAAENQRQQVVNQLQLLATDYRILLKQFRILTNTREPATPVADSIVYLLSSLPESLVVNNPQLQLNEQQVLLSEQQQKLEKSRLLPSINLGYNNTSIIGWQATGLNTEEYFGGRKRFPSVSAGIGIPVFSGAQRSRINAANVLTQQRKLELEATKQQFQSDLDNTIESYLQASKVLSSYNSTLLPNATAITNTATNKLNAGDIGYLNWVILVNQAIEVRSQYFEIVQQLNESAFEIERLSFTR